MDGSVKDGMAAHFYILLCGKDVKSAQLSRIRDMTGDPNTMHSLCPDHFGALPSLILVAIISHIYRITANTGYLNIEIDNITVVKYLRNEGHDTVRDDNHNPTDYDLWQESMTIIMYRIYMSLLLLVCI